MPLIAATLALSACAAAPGRYPSLERRPAERITGSAAPASADAVPTAVPDAPSADLATRVAQLLDQARAGQRGFAAKQAGAERAVASAGSLGSESWATASTALAEIESIQGDAAQALAELDQLEATQQLTDAGAQTADVTAIAAAREEVAKIADQESAVIARLRERLAG